MLKSHSCRWRCQQNLFFKI